jgi:hypothetical protein
MGAGRAVCRFDRLFTQGMRNRDAVLTIADKAALACLDQLDRRQGSEVEAGDGVYRG